MAAIRQQRDVFLVFAPDGNKVRVEPIRAKYNFIIPRMDNQPARPVTMHTDGRERVIVHMPHKKLPFEFYAAVETVNYAAHGYKKIGQIWHDPKNALQVKCANEHKERVDAEILEAQKFEKIHNVSFWTSCCMSIWRFCCGKTEV